MNRRSAVTLTEVLIAIFVMALGLMSILALFPLGAVQMAQALKDQRSAEAAANAAAWFRMAWKDACELGGQGQPDPRQRFVIALSRPSRGFDRLGEDQNVITNPTYGPADIGQNIGPPDPSVSLPPISSALFTLGTVAPSYPVYVDPIGWQSNTFSPAQQWWVAGSTIPRRPFYFRRQQVNPNGVINVFDRLNGHQRILRHFSLLDDMTFTPDGTAQLAAGNTIERQGKYTWAFMVRRPNNLVARQIDLTVVVYSGRSIDVASAENVYLTPPASDPEAVPATGGVSNIALDYTPPNKPALRRGWWVLDATLSPVPQGFFYRVVNVNDDTPGRLRLELQTPLKAANSAQRRLVVLDNVVEVFEKGTIDPKEEIRPF